MWGLKCIVLWGNKKTLTSVTDWPLTASIRVRCPPRRWPAAGQGSELRTSAPSCSCRTWRTGKAHTFLFLHSMDRTTLHFSVSSHQGQNYWKHFSVSSHQGQNYSTSTRKRATKHSSIQQINNLWGELQNNLKNTFLFAKLGRVSSTTTLQFPTACKESFTCEARST